MSVTSSKLCDLIIRSWEAGLKADLGDIRRRPGATTFPGYYRFLYGLCRVTAARKILEVGTDYGGSIIAMRQALPRDATATLITVDISNASDEQLASYPDVFKIQGDACAQGTVERVMSSISAPIDLLYIDTEHDFRTTIATFGIYSSLLTPRYIVFDDVTLNDEMAQVWTAVRTRYGANAVNAAEIVPAIREHPANPGFGVVIAGSAFA